nr:uncharacterized protein LOC113829312 [Penaeus vannamei]
MVIRYINPPKICNGTKLIVTNLKKNITVGNILGGVCDGEQVIMPRVTLISTDTPVNFKRKQFPVKLSFAMAINKSQGRRSIDVDCSDVNLETTPTTPGFSEGEMEHGTITIPENVFKLAEEEAIKMILPDYEPDFVSTNTRDSLEELKDDILDTRRSPKSAKRPRAKRASAVGQRQVA